MKHIHPDPYGYRVEIERNGVKFAGFVKFGADRAAALRQARAMREDVLAKLAPKTGRSNTGVAGVTEITHWTQGYPQTCFVVTHGKPGPNWKHRFFYKTFSQRQRQLEAAIRCRAKLAGEPVAQLLEAAYV
jgi:hypothetical protein